VIQNLPSHPPVVGSIFISKEGEQTRLGPWTIVVLTQLEGGRLDQRAPSTCTVFLAPSQGRSVCANQIFASLAPSTTRCEVLTYRLTHPTQCSNQSPRVADSSNVNNIPPCCTSHLQQPTTDPALAYLDPYTSSHFDRPHNTYTYWKFLPFSFSSLHRFAIIIDRLPLTHLHIQIFISATTTSVSRVSIFVVFCVQSCLWPVSYRCQYILLAGTC